MKDLLMLYARYNWEINSKIRQIVLQLDPSMVTREMNTHYGSLLGLLKHIALGSWNYLKAIGHLLGKQFVFLSHKEMESAKSSDEILKVLETLDIQFVSMAELITESELLIEKKAMQIYNGRYVDMSVWKFCLQHITHQVHHQGQLSQLLDELGVEHEFGNIFPLIADAEGTVPAESSAT